MAQAKTRVLVSGYFDPLHIGHLDLMSRAKKLGDHLIVVVNNDAQAILKKGKFFMNETERLTIIRSLRLVDEAILSIDQDKTIRKTLRNIQPDIFANGGDHITGNIPEQKVCEELGIQIITNLGKKLQSSSQLTGIKSLK